MAILQFSMFSLLLAGSTSLVSAIAAPSLEERTPQECVAAGSIIDSCAAATSGFLQLSSNQQAHCFCLDANGNYDFGRFDFAASGCFDYLRTAQPDLASVYGSSVVGACSKFGASLAAAPATTIATGRFTPPSSTLSSPKSTGMGSTSSLADSGPTTTTSGAGNAQTSLTATGSPTATAAVKSGANKVVMLSSGLWLGVLTVLALVV